MTEPTRRARGAAGEPRHAPWACAERPARAPLSRGRRDVSELPGREAALPARRESARLQERAGGQRNADQREVDEAAAAADRQDRQQADQGDGQPEPDAGPGQREQQRAGQRREDAPGEQAGRPVEVRRHVGVGVVRHEQQHAGVVEQVLGQPGRRRGEVVAVGAEDAEQRQAQGHVQRGQRPERPGLAQERPDRGAAAGDRGAIGGRVAVRREAGGARSRARQPTGRAGTGRARARPAAARSCSPSRAARPRRRASAAARQAARPRAARWQCRATSAKRVACRSKRAASQPTDSTAIGWRAKTAPAASDGRAPRPSRRASSSVRPALARWSARSRA